MKSFLFFNCFGEVNVCDELVTCIHYLIVYPILTIRFVWINYAVYAFSWYPWIVPALLRPFFFIQGTTGIYNCDIS